MRLTGLEPAGRRAAAIHPGVAEIPSAEGEFLTPRNLEVSIDVVRLWTASNCGAMFYAMRARQASGPPKWPVNP